MANIEFKKRVLFIGVPDMAYMGLDAFLMAGVNIVGVIGPLKTHNTYVDFRNYVLSKKLNFIEYDKIDEPKLINTLKSLNIDIAATFSFNHKIPKIFMDQIKDGILNLHPSLLPLYRGGNPYSRVIMNGEKETGVTVHFMAEGFDTGDIIYQEKCPLEKDETMGTLFNKTNLIGCKMQLAALMHYETYGSLPRRKQPEGEFITAPNVKSDEKFINYNKTAVEIDALVRGLNPYLSAMTFFGNQIITMHKVSVVDLPNVENFENGTICKIENNKVYIKTAKGCIIPEVLQFGGLFTGNCEDFIKIAQPKVGERFLNG